MNVGRQSLAAKNALIIQLIFSCTASQAAIDATRRAHAVMNDMSLSMRQATEQAREINRSVRRN